MGRPDYITPQGMRRLREELRQGWQRRRDVVAALSAAAAEGDRSENAEYIYRKKELRELDRRLRYLDRRGKELRIADQLPADTGRVYFGAWLELEDENGDCREYRIVGADETDPERQWISMHSPLARACLGRALDDEVRVDTPGGRRAFCIVSIRYAPPE